MKDKPSKPGDEPAEEKATPPPDNPARRSAEWEELEKTQESEEERALLRLKALKSVKGHQKP